MNHCVPEFEMEDDCAIPTLARPKKSSMADDEIMELLWQNGQVITQSQNLQRKSPPPELDLRNHHHLFMQEDEMASWLHYPLVDNDFSTDLLYPPPAATATTASAPPPRPGPSGSKSGVATVVDSCDAPPLAGITTASAKEVSSPADSSDSAAEPSPPIPPPELDRKRKGVEPRDDAECQSEDADFESGDTKKQTRRTSSAKRTRAAEVHNLSERRRRDRINEKMKALQELIPRCNKSDKASMLDEAIEYLKSLQLQVQMMSMGCGMVPMMFPGIQQYMPPMGMGMGMNRPMMQFPNMLAGSPMAGPAAAAHMGPRFPMPGFHMPSEPDHLFPHFAVHNPNQPGFPNFPDPCQQYLGPHQMHLPVQPQNQGMVQPSNGKPSTNRGPENPEHHQTG